MHKIISYAGKAIFILSFIIVGAKLLTGASRRDSHSFPLGSIASAPITCHLPCWHNIIPGVTHLADAETILRDDTDFATFYKAPHLLIVRLAQEPLNTSLQLTSDSNDLVNTIMLTGHEQIGQILNVLGQPLQQVPIVNINVDYSLGLLYPFGGVQVLIDATPKLETDALISVMLTASAGLARSWLLNSSFPYADRPQFADWQGLSIRNFGQRCPRRGVVCFD